MDEAPTQKKEWVLTGQAFEKLLGLFDPDPDIAAIRYEEMRRRLRKFFDWNRTKDPDELVDETFDRAARRIDEGVEVHSVASYLTGIARFLLKEYWVSDASKTEEIGDLPVVGDTRLVPEEEEREESDRLLQCLEGCTGSLAQTERQRVVEYYSGEKREKIDNRIRMAREMGVTLGNLRVRMLRLRDRLEKCILECVDKQGETK
jgi:DNA-directed RNA polymerase specialized sigma24 family protein